MSNLKRYTIWTCLIVIFASYSTFLKSANDLIKEYQLAMSEIDKSLVRRAMAREPGTTQIEELEEETTEYTIKDITPLESEIEPLDVEGKIRAIAKEKGFKNADLLVAITYAESTHKKSCTELNNPDCINTKNDSYDRGIWQWSRLWHPEVSDECAFDVVCSTEKAIDHINKWGTGAWSASEHNWGK